MTDSLDKLKKAFEQAISTSSAVQPWNEPLSRRDSVQSEQSQSAPIVQGGLGAWVGSSGFPYTGTTDLGVQTGFVPPARNAFELGLGLPGVPDVDFVPYAANTNRFGGKGPSLIGHPIGWEVIGPTLKSPYCDWQWNVNLAGNTLTLEPGPYPMPGSVLPDPGSAYQLDPISDYEAAGGLYVLFSFTGENFTGSLAGGRTPITPVFKGKAPFELFRVALLVGQTFTLHGQKQLVNYYGGGDGCRAITLVRPKVARMAAFPVPVVGQAQANRTFVFMPPETSARSEYMPPAKSPALTGTWLTGGFDVLGTIPAAAGTHYGTSVKIPIPKPIVRLDAEIPVGGPYGADEWTISVPVSNAAITVGRILRVSNLIDSLPTGLTNGGPPNAFGYFEITKITPGPPDVLLLRRVVEANPDNGAVFFGNGPVAGATPVPVSIEIYDNLSSFFLDPHFNLAALASSRLTNLIDPRTSGPSVTYRDTSGPALVPPSKPDRAIFNTKATEDPGNLLDLGFRAVFFPAKLDGGGLAVPDFDRPIDGNDLVLDSTIAERQFIEVDYSAGVAYLSHTPQPGSDVFPTGFGPFGAPNNPRREIILFSAFVPYSMEDGQTGGGIRVAGSGPLAEASGFGDSDYADVFGRRVISEPNAVQTLNPVGTPQVTTTLTSLFDIPASGFFFVAQSIGGAPISTKIGPYTYQYTTLVGPNVRLNGVTGPAGAVVLDPALGWKVVLQRSFREYVPNNVSSDTVRGSSKRVSSLLFKNTDITFGADGSIILHPLGGTLDDAYHAGRVIVSDAGPIEIRPAGFSPVPASVDPAGLETHITSRYDLGTAPTFTKVGFDAVGRREILPYTGPDNYAGFIDRRVFAPQSGYTILGTVTTYLFDINTLGTDEISVTTGGDQFHEGGATNRTLLMDDLDLIEIPGLGTFLFHAPVNGNPTNYTLRNLDGSVPVLAANGWKGCTAFRPRFFTGYGFNTGSLIATQGSTWIAGQGPKPALRLFAGSGFVENGPDNGGALNALEFWFRLGEKTPSTFMAFDTFGREFSTLTAQRLPTIDRHYRGNYLTRQLINPFPPPFVDLFSVGHLTETWQSGFKYGYDFASLHAYDGQIYAITVAANNEFVIAGTTPDPLDMGALGGALFVAIDNLNLPTPSTAPNGLFVCTPGVTRDSGPPNLHFFVKDLSGALTLPVGATGLARFFVGSYLGKYQDSAYSVGGTGFAESNHTPVVTVPLSREANSVGVHISGPNQTTRGPDARALRVTATAETVIGPLGTQYQEEQFALDLQGNAEARGFYNYKPVKTTSKKVSAHAFQAEKISSVAADPGTNWYYPGIGSGIVSNGSTSGNYSVIAKLDLAEVLPGDCILKNVVFRVLPGAVRPAVPTRMQFALYRSVGTSAVPVQLNPATNDNGANAEQNVTMTLTVPETLDFTSFDYWLVVYSASAAVPGDDFLFGATLNYDDQGPRN